MTRMILPTFLCLLVLAGCEQPAQGPLTASCTEGSHAGLVGKNIGAITLPQALPQRVITPETAVTLDHRPERLNIHVDDKGWITRVACG